MIHVCAKCRKRKSSIYLCSIPPQYLANHNNNDGSRIEAKKKSHNNCGIVRTAHAIYEYTLLTMFSDATDLPGICTEHKRIHANIPHYGYTLYINLHHHIQCECVLSPHGHNRMHGDSNYKGTKPIIALFFSLSYSPHTYILFFVNLLFYKSTFPLRHQTGLIRSHRYFFYSLFLSIHLFLCGMCECNNIIMSSTR